MYVAEDRSWDPVHTPAVLPNPTSIFNIASPQVFFKNKIIPFDLELMR